MLLSYVWISTFYTDIKEHSWQIMEELKLKTDIFKTYILETSLKVCGTFIWSCRMSLGLSLRACLCLQWYGLVTKSQGVSKCQKSLYCLRRSVSLYACMSVLLTELPIPKPSQYLHPVTVERINERLHLRCKTVVRHHCSFLENKLRIIYLKTFWDSSWCPQAYHNYDIGVEYCH